MFTGIIEEVGVVAELTGGAEGGRLRVDAQRVLAKLSAGASVAVSGCCLTVTAVDEQSFTCDLSPETLARTGFRRLRRASRVNLEAPLVLGAPLGGHIVQGHVDGTGRFVGLPSAGDENYWLDVEVPPELARYLVEKGSVAVEGISLTVAAIKGRRLRAAIIPFTIENTNLASLQAGEPVNIECDVLAKYVEKLLREGRIEAGGLTLERLREEGF